MTATLDSLIAVCREAAASETNVSPQARPYRLLAANRREEAVQAWESLLAEHPNDIQLWHELALAHYWDAKYTETRKGDAIAKWRRAVPYFAAVLAADEWWRNWAAERAVPCGVLEGDRMAVRKIFHSHVVPSPPPPEKDRVEEFCETVMAARSAAEERIEALFMAAGGAYIDLLVSFRHEIAVARLIDRCKMAWRIAECYKRTEIEEALEEYLVERRDRSGVDLDKLLNTVYVFENLHLGEPHELPSCGPRMLRVLGLDDRADELMAEVAGLKGDSPGVDGLLARVASQLPLARIWRDPDRGRLMAMVGLGMYRECREGVLAIPGYSTDARMLRLLCWSCHEEARSALSHDRLAEAVGAFDTANLYAFSVLKNPAPFVYDMPGLAKSICLHIQNAWGMGKTPREETRNLLLTIHASTVAPPLSGQLLAVL